MMMIQNKNRIIIMIRFVTTITMPRPNTAVSHPDLATSIGASGTVSLLQVIVEDIFNVHCHHYHHHYCYRHHHHHHHYDCHRNSSHHRRGPTEASLPVVRIRSSSIEAGIDAMIFFLSIFSISRNYRNHHSFIFQGLHGWDPP